VLPIFRMKRQTPSERLQARQSFDVHQIMIRLIPLLFILTCQYTFADVDGTIVLLPKNWDHKSTLPVAIWLHGYGANPSKIRTDAHYQAAADTLNIAVIGIPATRKVGPDSFVWTDDTIFDSEHVEQALSETEVRLGTKFGAKALFGFSQGAVVAAELAARYPSKYAGAIILSPGADIFPLATVASEQNKLQKYFISTGAGEALGNLRFARAYRKILSELGSTVVYREVPGMTKHDRPPDWPDRFREWTSLILNIDRKANNQSPEPPVMPVTPAIGEPVAPTTAAAHL